MNAIEKEGKHSDDGNDDERCSQHIRSIEYNGQYYELSWCSIPHCKHRSPYWLSYAMRYTATRRKTWTKCRYQLLNSFRYMSNKMSNTLCDPHRPTLLCSAHFETLHRIRIDTYYSRGSLIDQAVAMEWTWSGSHSIQSCHGSSDIRYKRVIELALLLDSNQTYTVALPL